MMRLTSFGMPTLQQHHHRKNSGIATQQRIRRKNQITMEAKTSDLLDFSYSGGLPPAKVSSPKSGFEIVSDSMKLCEELVSRTPFAQTALLYSSPFSDEAASDLALFAQYVVTDVRKMPVVVDDLKTLSLSMNIGKDGPVKQEEDMERALEGVRRGEFTSVILEPLHGLGKGGLDQRFVKALRLACDSSKTLLVFDETRTGLGRTGALWYHLRLGVQPDVMMVHFGRNMNVGALLVKEPLSYLYPTSNIFNKNSVHALNYLKKVSHDDYLKHVCEKGSYFKHCLDKKLAQHVHYIISIKSFGLLVVIQMKSCAKVVAEACWDEGLAVTGSEGPDMIRLFPPLDVTLPQIHQAVAIIEKCMVRCYF